MLKSLFIKDVVLIDHLHLNFEKGLSILTGETGAGKSILLDALGLALGMRAESGLIRSGSIQATVIAQFQIPIQNKKDSLHSLYELLQEHGLIHEVDKVIDIDLSLKRILTQAAQDQPTRSRAFINDIPVSIQLLRTIGDELLEIHGQFDRLLDPSSHREFIDSFASLGADVDLTNQAYRHWNEAQKLLDARKEMILNDQKNFELYTYHLSELDQISPQLDEETQILTQRQQLLHSHKIEKSFQEAWKDLNQPTLVTTLIHSAHKKVARFEDNLNPEQKQWLDKIDQLAIDLEDAVSCIQNWAHSSKDNEQTLQALDERLHLLRELARKHGVAPANLYEFHTQLNEKVHNFQNAQNQLDELEQKAIQLRQQYCDLAFALQTKRIAIIKDLDTQVMAEFPPLKLDRAEFKTYHKVLDESQWGPYGMDHIEFNVAMNAGQTFSSLNKSASGGELSRIMLALKVVLANRSFLPTIIFDEIDTGVGGAVANAIGERLSKLSNHLQVLAITHSPQVASWSNQHYHVQKEQVGSTIVTNVKQLEWQDRVDEIARMLSGDHITAESRAAATQLLNKKH